MSIEEETLFKEDSWDVRCKSCGWVYTSDGPGLLRFDESAVLVDETAALLEARRHDCEPLMEIRAPRGTWRLASRSAS